MKAMLAVPVLMLTARGEGADRIRGLELGAASKGCERIATVQGIGYALVRI